MNYFYYIAWRLAEGPTPQKTILLQNVTHSLRQDLVNMVMGDEPLRSIEGRKFLCYLHNY